MLLNALYLPFMGRQPWSNKSRNTARAPYLQLCRQGRIVDPSGPRAGRPHGGPRGGPAGDAGRLDRRLVGVRQGAEERARTGRNLHSWPLRNCYLNSGKVGLRALPSPLSPSFGRGSPSPRSVFKEDSATDRSRPSTSCYASPRAASHIGSRNQSGVPVKRVLLSLLVRASHARDRGQRLDRCGRHSATVPGPPRRPTRLPQRPVEWLI